MTKLGPRQVGLLLGTGVAVVLAAWFLYWGLTTPKVYDVFNVASSTRSGKPTTVQVLVGLVLVAIGCVVGAVTSNLRQVRRVTLGSGVLSVGLFLAIASGFWGIRRAHDYSKLYHSHFEPWVAAAERDAMACEHSLADLKQQGGDPATIVALEQLCSKHHERATAAEQAGRKKADEGASDEEVAEEMRKVQAGLQVTASYSDVAAKQPSPELAAKAREEGLKMAERAQQQGRTTAPTGNKEEYRSAGGAIPSAAAGGKAKPAAPTQPTTSPNPTTPPNSTTPPNPNAPANPNTPPPPTTPVNPSAPAPPSNPPTSPTSPPAPNNPANPASSPNPAPGPSGGGLSPFERVAATGTCLYYGMPPKVCEGVIRAFNKLFGGGTKGGEIFDGAMSIIATAAGPNGDFSTFDPDKFLEQFKNSNFKDPELAIESIRNAMTELEKQGLPKDVLDRVQRKLDDMTSTYTRFKSCIPVLKAAAQKALSQGQPKDVEIGEWFKSLTATVHNSFAGDCKFLGDEEGKLYGLIKDNDVVQCVLRLVGKTSDLYKNTQFKTELDGLLDDCEQTGVLLQPLLQ